MILILNSTVITSIWNNIFFSFFILLRFVFELRLLPYLDLNVESWTRHKLKGPIKNSPSTKNSEEKMTQSPNALKTFPSQKRIVPKREKQQKLCLLTLPHSFFIFYFQNKILTEFKFVEIAISFALL